MAIPTTLHEEQEAFWYLSSLRIIKAIGEQSEHTVQLTEHILPAGTRIYARHHWDEDEGIYVVEGEAIFSCGEGAMNVAPGTLLFYPQNVYHHLEVGKTMSFRYLSWIAATGFVQNVLHIGEPGQTLVLSPPPFTPQERIQQLAELIKDVTIPSPEHYKALLEL